MCFPYDKSYASQKISRSSTRKKSPKETFYDRFFGHCSSCDGYKFFLKKYHERLYCIRCEDNPKAQMITRDFVVN